MKNRTRKIIISLLADAHLSLIGVSIYLMMLGTSPVERALYMLSIAFNVWFCALDIWFVGRLK